MTNQSPAEALSFELQNILRPITIMMYMPPTTPPTVQEALKLEAAIEKEITEAVTAYAATVEREARIDELEKVLPESAKAAGLPDDAKMGQLRSIDIGDYITDRLAALQGPPDEAEGKA